MIDTPSRDDEFVAQIRRSIPIESRMYWSLMIMVLIISALFAGILEFHLPMESTGIAALAVLLIWIAVVFRNVSTVPPVAGPYDEDILRKTIDDQHRRWRYTFNFILIGCLAAMFTFSAMISIGVLHPVAGHRVAGSDPLVGTAMDFAFFAVFAVFQVCFGPGFLKRAHRRALNDEHTRALQHSAAMFGYPLSVTLMCAVLCAMAARPQWGLLIMPGTIAAAAILPGLYFLIRQWRAGRDG